MQVKISLSAINHMIYIFHVYVCNNYVFVHILWVMLLYQQFGGEEKINSFKNNKKEKSSKIPFNV